MAIDNTASVQGVLSAPAIRLYAAYARNDLNQAAVILAEHPDAEDELLAWHLIAYDLQHPEPVVRDPQQAMQRKLAAELEESQRRVAMMTQLPALSDRLGQAYRAGQVRSFEHASEYLADQAVVNARLKDAVGGARREILAAQPGGPRTQQHVDIAMARDTAALDRGIVLRTIYRDTVRDDLLTGEYARSMSMRGAGRSAQYRTLPGHFERMIIVDREEAFVSDHIVPGAPAHSAWHVTDRAVVAVLAEVFGSTWMRAQPWAGEIRPRRGTEPVDTVSGGEGVRTTARQREIMRNLCSGFSQPSAARRLGMSERKMEKEVAGLKALWGVSTMNELIFQYAQSPDRLVDDTAGGGLEDTEAAA